MGIFDADMGKAESQTRDLGRSDCVMESGLQGGWRCRKRGTEDAVESTGAKMRELAGKLHADLPFAKRDIAWGKLDAKELSEMYKLFRNVYVPVYVSPAFRLLTVLGAIH